MSVRYDVLSIFPDYLQPLELSLIGKAAQDGLLSVNVTDLRDFTTDRHRTVDDTPYGGGAGMVMKPEPWAQALEAVLAASPLAESSSSASPLASAEATHDDAARPVLVIPSPAGARFTQAEAAELAKKEHLIFACGRYEGIDERVFEWAAERFDVRLLSLGDYVLNGGEVAALAMIEAIARLLPGVVGNPESLVEESHQDGLLEYPVYTKPSTWRDREVPEVLLSGNHAKIAKWRRGQQIQRTAQRRADLLEHADAAHLSPADREELSLLGYGVVGGEVLKLHHTD